MIDYSIAGRQSSYSVNVGLVFVAIFGSFVRSVSIRYRVYSSPGLRSRFPWVLNVFSPDATETRKIKKKKTESLVSCGRSLMQQNRVLQNPNKKSEGEEDKVLFSQGRGTRGN